ncbi:hypothetical protein [Acidisphaera sp. S103]|uniref:hypothetical protein n=1 Tax=Acidisphaera sp. S103 TaxID=1747223 RepID=UPI00131E6A4A|nr:hypothetical protein [Acidisphaera sp. S103]
MPLEIYLSSAPGATTGSTVSVEGNQVFLNEAFPPGGLLVQRPFSTPAGYTGDLTIYFGIGEDQCRMQMSNFPYDSVLSLLALPDRRFLGSTFHDAVTAATCVVVCADNTQGTNCVICRQDGIVARVCC